MQTLKAHFERHDMTDCSVQNSSEEFKDLAKSYNLQLLLVSPKHPNENGETLLAMKIVNPFSLSSNTNTCCRFFSVTTIRGIKGKNKPSYCMPFTRLKSLKIKRGKAENMPYNCNRCCKKELAPLN